MSIILKQIDHIFFNLYLWLEDFWKTKFHKVFQISVHYTESEACFHTNLHGDSISNHVIIKLIKKVID